MIKLGAGPELLTRYQPLLKSHLQATTSVMDPAVQRHQNEKLAWFWKMDAQGDMETDLWMQECKLPLIENTAAAETPFSLPGALAEIKGLH